MGAAIGLTLATLAALLQFGGLGGLLLVWLVFMIGQLLEKHVHHSQAGGRAHWPASLVVIFALLAFGQLFGFVGVMMALPVSAALVVVVKLAQARYLASRFIAAGAEGTPMAPPIRTVRLILGDQLNIRHPWFAQVDDSDALPDGRAAGSPLCAPSLAKLLGFCWPCASLPTPCALLATGCTIAYRRCRQPTAAARGAAPDTHRARRGAL